RSEVGGGAAIRPRIRKNAGPMRAGVRVLTHPQGVRLDGDLLRGGAATVIYHCTSPPFVPGNRTRWTWCAQERDRAARQVSGRDGKRQPGGGGAEDLERPGQVRVCAGRQ